MVMAAALLTALLLSAILTGANVTATAASSDSLLAVYVLAFDNNPSEPMTLSSYYTATVNSIISATAGSQDKTAVILADLDAGMNTHILIVENGNKVQLSGLPRLEPDESVILDTSLNELDMSDGESIGLFLRWARQQYPDRPTIFSYLGHGAPVVPKVNHFALSPTAEEPVSLPDDPHNEADFGEEREVEPIPPLPAKWHAHQGLTDYSSGSLLSIADLSTALSLGTDSGAKPLKTIDLVQCFSASIEELYELHPYAETITAAPNYSYSKPDMVGLALAQITSSMSAGEIADKILATYDGELPVEGHPRLLVGVDSFKVPAIKEAWDRTSQHLLDALYQSPQSARDRISRAYDASAKYDTTLCDATDFSLAPPDAMSDMSDFATHLSSAFGQTSPVGSWAITTTVRINEAVLSRYAHGGIPWFAEDASTGPWSFDGPGISIFTDFSADSAYGRSWQAYWYTDTASSFVPHPFQFLAHEPGQTGWADVFNTYWGYDAESHLEPDFNTSQESDQSECEPAFLFGRGPGELTAKNLVVQIGHGDISAASLVRFQPGLAFEMSVDVETLNKATNPQVLFNIYRNGRRIMSEVETPGYMAAQSVSQVQLSRNWLAQYPGTYTFEVIVDSDERFSETNEDDNHLRSSISVIAPVLHLPFVVP